MATTWGKPSLSMVARAAFLRSRKNAACSSGLRRICCRRLVAIALVALLHGHFLACTDGAELRPERLVDLPPHQRCLAIPVTTELAGPTVVGGVGGTRELSTRLPLLVLRNGEPREVVEEDFTAGAAVVRDVAGQAVEIV